MNGLYDIHSHILPRLDDGARDMEDTIETLKEAVRQKVRGMIATPHFHPGRYFTEADQVRESLKAVQAECRRRELKIRLYPGHECYYYSGLIDDLRAGRALTMADSRYVLVEFSPDCLYSYMLQGLEKLWMAGYRPILAHFERYSCLADREKLLNLKQKGVLLQLNLSRLQEKETFFRKNPWGKLVREGTADFLATDCHGIYFRPMDAEKAFPWIKKNLSPERQKEIFSTNVKKILKNEKWETTWKS